MAITYSTNAKNAALDAVDALLDAGSAPVCVILTSGDAVLATVLLNTSGVFAAADGGVASLNTPAASPATATGTGTAAKFQLKTDAAGTVVIAGSVSESGGGGDLIITNTNINTGDSVYLAAGGITITV